MDGRHETPNGSGDSGDFATHFTNEVTQIVTACKGLSRDFTQYNKFTLSELRQVDDERVILREQLHAAKKKLRRANLRVAELEKAKSQLRDIILKNSGKKKVCDQDMLQHYRELRHRLQSIANSKLLDLKSEPPIQVENLHSVNLCYLRFNTASSRNRPSIIQAAIFGIIHRSILEANLFGVGNADPRAKSGMGGPNEIEASLQEFENLLVANKISADLIKEWRIATVKCAEGMPAPARLAVTAEDQIFQILQPILKQTPSHIEDKKKIVADVQQLCEWAYKFRILTRGSMEHYWCESYEPGYSLEDHQDEAEIYGVDGEGEPGGSVSYTLFGSLWKNPIYGDGDSVVLEPAQVIVYPKIKREGNTESSEATPLADIDMKEVKLEGLC